MKKFVTCRIIDAEDTAPSSYSQSASYETHPKPSGRQAGVRQRIVAIYGAPSQDPHRPSELNTVI